MKVSTILPTYNEALNIVPLIQRLIQAANNHYDIEIIVVDDDSPDKTWELVQNLNIPNVRVIRRTDVRGLASAIARGIDESSGDIVTWMDCDLSMSPELVPKLVFAIQNGFDVAVGSRYIKGGKDVRRPIRIITSKIFNFYANILLTFKVKDLDSGFVATKKSVLQHIPLSRKGYGQYCIDFLYRCVRKKFKIKEVPYVFGDREFGVSKTEAKWYSLLVHGWEYGIAVLRIRFKS